MESLAIKDHLGHLVLLGRKERGGQGESLEHKDHGEIVDFRVLLDQLEIMATRVCLDLQAFLDPLDHLAIP